MTKLDEHLAKHPEDQKFLLDKPSAGFSPERNKAIVEQTIKDYEAMQAKKAKEHDDHYGERADAVVTYLRSLDGRSSTGLGASTNMEKYFGRRTLAYLRGQQIRDQLMAGLTVKDKSGKVIKTGI